MQKWLKKIKTTEYTDKDKGDEFENDCKEPLNSRFITNIGAYREYLIRYLNEHNLLDNEQYTMVRYRDASSEGVTIEVRAYTERQYADLYTYEIITSDILEVMLAILPEFRLGLFQAESSTGSDIVINKSNL
jgi:miniconductance mechanosensitive channel